MIMTMNAVRVDVLAKRHSYMCDICEATADTRVSWAMARYRVCDDLFSRMVYTCARHLNKAVDKIATPE